MKKYISLTLVSSLLSAILAIFIYRQFFPDHTIVIQESIPYQQVTYHDPGEGEYTENPVYIAPKQDFVHAAYKSVQAIVYIRSVKSSGEIFYNRDVTNASGSGVIVSPDGFIVTNYHVIKDANSIEITLNDKREYKAKVIGSDSSTDLALLKIIEQSLPYLEIGDSDSLSIGEWVLAVGNPFRLQSTVTAGIVSAKARNINILQRSDIESFIQTDAAVNPGNSGGGLINTRGELVGINTAIITNSGGYEGFSFAIPSNIVKKVIYDIKEYGAVQRGWLGITISDVNDQRAKSLDLGTVSGVLIEIVENNSAANEAGLRKNDVLLAVNGTQIRTTPEFLEQIALYRPGDRLNLKVRRNGKSFITQIVLRNHLNSTDYVSIRRDPVLVDLGFELRNLDSLEKEKFGKDGAIVISIRRGSIVDETNMEPNFIITTVNNQSIKSVEEIVEVLEKTEGLVELEGFYEDYPGKFPYRFYIK